MVLTSCSPLQPLVIDGKICRFLSILGCGATCTVFKASWGGKEVAVKYGEESVLENEATIVEVLKGRNITIGCQKIIRNNIGQIEAITYDVGKPVLGGGWTPPADATNLTLENLQQVFLKLIDLHTKVGLVHRDLRLPNILVDVKGIACLIDFGYALKITNDPIPFAGSKITASQRILDFLSKGTKVFTYTPEDDLESFLKLCILMRERFSLPEIVQSNVHVAQSWRETWGDHPHVKAFIKQKTYSEMVDYIKLAFFFPLLPDRLMQAAMSSSRATSPRTSRRFNSEIGICSTVKNSARDLNWCREEESSNPLERRKRARK